MKNMYTCIFLVGYTALNCAQDVQTKSDQLLSFALFGTMKPLSLEKQYLVDRISQETARAIKGTILDNNSLPTSENLTEWVDAFVNVYESPYVLSRLTASEKAAYAQKLRTFFSKSFIENYVDVRNVDQQVTTLQQIYTTLPSRLKAAIRNRMIPALELGINEAKFKVLELQKQFNEYKGLEQQFKTKLTETVDPQAKNFLQKNYQDLERQLAQTQEAGLQSAFILSLYSAFLSVIL